MAIVQNPIVQVKIPSIPDGRYIIKSRVADIYWNVVNRPFDMVYLWEPVPHTGTKMELAKHYNSYFAHVSEHSPIIQVFKR
jgi:hypothetical protein